MLLKSRVTKLKDLEIGILQNIKTLLTVEEKRKQKLWFFTRWIPKKLVIDSWHLVLSIRMEAYDGEINLGVEENMISNEYAVKLRLEHEVKRGNKIVKKELIVALRGEIYFMKFIINPDEDDVEPGVIFIRSFLHMTKAITDFGARTIIIYPDIDPEELSTFVCKMGKSSRNKKRAMENLNLFYPDIGTSSSTGRHLTLEEAAKEALALRIS
ncbi:hypothetical protein Tco_0732824 [Tanacetum coccineum]